MIKIRDASKLKSTIVKAGHTMISFSKAIDVSNQMIYQVFAEKRNPSPAVAKKITDTLQVDWDDVFEYVEEGAEHETTTA